MPSPDWVSLYKSAVLESNREQFIMKAETAKTAILERLKQIESEQEKKDFDELKALAEALQNLYQLLAGDRGSA